LHTPRFPTRIEFISLLFQKKKKSIIQGCELSSILGKQKQFKANNILTYFFASSAHPLPYFAVLRDRLVRRDESNVHRSKKKSVANGIFRWNPQQEWNSLFFFVLEDTTLLYDS